MTYRFSSGIAVEFKLNPTPEEAVMQNIYSLVHTTIGEIPCYRDYGLDKSYLSTPSIIGKNLALAAIADAMGKFCPELNIDQITFEGDVYHPEQMIAVMEVTDGNE